MDSRVKKIIDDYRNGVNIFTLLGHKEVHSKILAIMDSDGFIHAVEYFVEHGYDDSVSIDNCIGSASAEYVVDAINAGIEPGNILAREALAFAFSRLEGFPDDAKEAMMRMGEIALSIDGMD